MFRNRNNTQKPDDEFIGHFQSTFAGMVPVPRWASHSTTWHSTFPEGSADSTASTRPVKQEDLRLDEHEMYLANERTLRNLQDYNSTRSWTDLQSMRIVSLVGQYTGFYTPNAGGNAATFHNQAVDPQTATAGLNMISPPSLSNSVLINQHNGSSTMNHFNQQYLAQQTPNMHFHTQQQTFAPSVFMHRDSFEAMDEFVDSMSIHKLPVDQASNISASAKYSGSINVDYSGSENFRYSVSLQAPTAMTKHSGEPPISYLNKGQTYNLTVMDSYTPTVVSDSLEYRTYVRVSFEEEQQRSKPAACWQLWEKGRGMSEMNQRGGKVLAVEYAYEQQGGDDHKHRQIQVERASFDGFCVTWSANPATGAAACTIPIRFNFLSTDFSHSRGEKGIPVRLCVKTGMLTAGDESNSSREAEMCYCKVKLYRAHGAERKLSNDIVHVKKVIEKLKQQIAQAEMGGGFGKRKRGNNLSGNMKASDQPKGPKHKHTRSMCSRDDQHKKLLKDHLRAKLVVMQGMLSSTRTISVLALRGDEKDDPDLCPVRLPAEGEAVQAVPLSRQDTGASQSIESLNHSPRSSEVYSNSSQPHEGKLPATMGKNNTPTVPQVTKLVSISRGYIEAVDIDPTYRPPTEYPPKPTACFYVRFAGTIQQPDYYRAIYLTERTVGDLIKKISEKSHLDPSRIVRTLHVTHNGLRIMADDDLVRELPEGQDMTADIYEYPAPLNADNDSSPGIPVEIKLTY